ncbi:hypothetical protein AAG570_008092 [Ranatra chinensis]|uniref:MIF4G domain-containing protein n=1 Tax=Ranatra chinensis TaxID=642074 RepID=A0ABD0YFJ3_9HEMI
MSRPIGSRTPPTSFIIVYQGETIIIYGRQGSTPVPLQHPFVFPSGIFRVSQRDGDNEESYPGEDFGPVLVFRNVTHTSKATQTDPAPPRRWIRKAGDRRCRRGAARPPRPRRLRLPSDSSRDDSSSTPSFETELQENYEEESMRINVTELLERIARHPEEQVLDGNLPLIQHYFSTAKSKVSFGRIVGELSVQNMSLVDVAVNLSSACMSLDTGYYYYLGLVNAILAVPESPAYGPIIARMYSSLVDKEGRRYSRLRDAFIEYFLMEMAFTSDASHLVGLMTETAGALSQDHPRMLKKILVRLTDWYMMLSEEDRAFLMLLRSQYTDEIDG